MRIKRAKKISKTLSYYKLNFGFHSPYLLILDGTFCSAALSNKVNIRDQLPKFLGDVKLLTTACCIKELETLQKLDSSVYGALMITKTFQVFKCNHKETLSGNDCIIDLVSGGGDGKKKVNLMVATNDYSLRSSLQNIAGVPLLWLHGNCPELLKPSEMSKRFVNKTSENNMLLTTHQEKTIKELKKQAFGEPEVKEKDSKKKKRKGPKGPNPLSCKKKKKKPQNDLRGVKDKLQSEGKKKKKKKKKNLLNLPS